MCLFLVISATEAMGKPAFIIAEQNRCLIALIAKAHEQNYWMDARTAVIRCSCIANAKAQNQSVDACPGWDTAGQWVRKGLKD